MFLSGFQVQVQSVWVCTCLVFDPIFSVRGSALPAHRCLLYWQLTGLVGENRWGFLQLPWQLGSLIIEITVLCPILNGAGGNRAEGNASRGKKYLKNEKYLFVVPLLVRLPFTKWTVFGNMEVVHFSATEGCHTNFKLLEVFSEGLWEGSLPIEFPAVRHIIWLAFPIASRSHWAASFSWSKSICASKSSFWKLSFW